MGPERKRKKVGHTKPPVVLTLKMRPDREAFPCEYCDYEYCIKQHWEVRDTCYSPRSVMSNQGGRLFGGKRWGTVESKVTIILTCALVHD